MKNARVSKLWDALHSSYWFLPSVMAVLATILAFTMLMLDRTGKSINYWWIYTGGASGARSLLEAVAGSMVSVSATAFSITIVALQLAASNFGHRLLRNFMQDTGNQVVLGTFIGTFIYCLLVLRTIHTEGDGPKVLELNFQSAEFQNIKQQLRLLSRAPHLKAMGSDDLIDLVLVHISNRQVEKLLTKLENINKVHITLLPTDIITLRPPASQASEQVKALV